MPNIRSVSDLWSYTEVLKGVDASNRVYLTWNGHGQYGILTMAEIDKLDRYKAAYMRLTEKVDTEECLEKMAVFLLVIRQETWNTAARKRRNLRECPC